MWWRLYELQDGRCATCDCSPATVDHDHADGTVRGLLCVSCNSLEGAYSRGQRRCAHERPCFGEYWENPPAKELGWIQVGRAYRHRQRVRSASYGPASQLA
ncbi:endonuclease domain-containing protein [Streptomyces sp. NE06-03E]|uniref:endonuclease domain-containing protein n=1 Tax=Streptomyces sp. NE06-03E TaxID=3028695 RepID=UPI0029B91A08|nr:endonuclease domain-containing protein [Streptomyces sp. NE06-03E]MDX3055971.1 endonuclease domain-containing protein [Streptomyces sp. NE06-03E]